MARLILFGLMLVAGSVVAGTQEGQVTSIVVRDSDGLHLFYMTGTATNRPECASQYRYWIIKDESSNVGKAQLSMLMTAYAAGKTVRVTGAGTCSRWRDGEDVNTLELK